MQRSPLLVPAFHADFNALSPLPERRQAPKRREFCVQDSSMTLTAEERLSTMRQQTSGRATDRPAIQGLEGRGPRHDLLRPSLFPGSALVSIRSRLRDPTHTPCPRRRTAPTSSASDTTTRTIAAGRTRPQGGDRVLGPRPTARTGRLRARPEGDAGRKLPAGRLFVAGHRSHHFVGMVAERYMEALGDRRGAGVNGTPPASARPAGWTRGGHQATAPASGSSRPPAT